VYGDVELLAHAGTPVLVASELRNVSSGFIHDAVEHAAVGIEAAAAEFERGCLAVLSLSLQAARLRDAVNLITYFCTSMGASGLSLWPVVM